MTEPSDLFFLAWQVIGFITFGIFPTTKFFVFFIDTKFFDVFIDETIDDNWLWLLFVFYVIIFFIFSIIFWPIIWLITFIYKDIV